jgi:hypothetical protein
MDRRTFVELTTGILLTLPLAANAKHAGRVYRIGYLSTPVPTLREPMA